MKVSRATYDIIIVSGAIRTLLKELGLLRSRDPVRSQLLETDLLYDSLANKTWKK